MATPEEAVADASNKFKAIEGNVQKAIDALNKLPKDFSAVQAGGPLDLPEGVKQFGALEAAEYSATAQVLAGELADALLNIVTFHQACTERAQELNIDGGMVVFSGGGR